MRDLKQLTVDLIKCRNELNKLEIKVKACVNAEDEEVLRNKLMEFDNKYNKLYEEIYFATGEFEKDLKNKGYAVVNGEYVIEKIFEYRGYKCVIALMSLGHRCGYVAIPNGHEYFGVDYDEIPISCHGELTYSGTDYPIPDGNWYIGFDCAHYMDRPDYDALFHYFSDNKEVMESIKWKIKADREFGLHGEVRSQDYVRNELMDIVNQLLGDDDEDEGSYSQLEEDLIFGRVQGEAWDI